MAEFVKVATVTEVSPGQIKLVELGERRIALVQVNGAFYAVNEVCPHQGGPLSEGDIEDYMITCPWHAFQVDVRTGKGENLPLNTETYPVRVVGDEIQVQL